MTLEQFIKKYLNKGVDFDGRYNAQCVDLFRAYVDEVLGYPQPKGVKGACQLWQNFNNDPNLKNYYQKIPNTASFIPQKGDIAIWKCTIGGGFGHVAICTGKGNTSWFESFDQNWKPQKATLEKHNYKNFYGVLRPKKNSAIEEISKLGFDYYNPKSMLVAVKAVKKLQAGELVDKTKYDDLAKEYNSILDSCEQTKLELKKKANYAKAEEIIIKNLRKAVADCKKNSKQLKNESANLSKQLELADNSYKSNLEKEKLNYDKKLKDLEIKLGADWQTKQDAFLKQIADLKEQLKQKQVVVHTKPELPKTLKDKLIAIINILFS